MPTDPTDPLTLAAISLPLIALAATYALHTIKGDKDTTSLRYRKIVGGIGVLSVTFGIAGAVLAFIGYWVGVFISGSVLSIMAAYILISSLSIHVILTEVIVGLEEREAVDVLVYVIVITLSGGGAFIYFSP